MSLHLFHVDDVGAFNGTTGHTESLPIGALAHHTVAACQISAIGNFGSDTVLSQSAYAETGGVAPFIRELAQPLSASVSAFPPDAAINAPGINR